VVKLLKNKISFAKGGYFTVRVKLINSRISLKSCCLFVTQFLASLKNLTCLKST
jgi:hypothetical protein